MTGLTTTSRPKVISLTPLIDVVFILLMFFMLTSTFTTPAALDLSTPVAGAPAEPQLPQVLELTADGRLRVTGQALPLDTDSEFLSALNKGRAIVLRPAPTVITQDIVGALNRLQRLGFGPLNLGRTSGEQTAGTPL
jgi:biopolymer transport protein ExbD